MFANKKTVFAKLFLGLLAIPIALAILPSPVAHADHHEGENFLSFLGCDDDNKDGLNFDDCVSSSGTGTVTSFTNFQGTLAAPDATGYASGLTQATDARTFILNVVNFALGFLGLIAVVVVIYGGVLMVTSAGGDGMGKGKKAITYAAIGLLVVMSSFALVNTILLAPSGKETGSSGSAINSSSIRGVAGNARFNYLAGKIDEIMLDVYNSYQFHLTAKQAIESAEANILAFNSGACFVPLGDCVNQFSAMVDGQMNIVSNLGSNASANAIFNTGLAPYLKKIVDLKNEKLPQILADIEDHDCNTDNKFAEINPCTEDNIRALRTEFDDLKKSVSEAMKNASNTKFLSDGYADQLKTAAFKTAQVYQAVYGLASAQIGQKHFSTLIPSFVTSGTGGNAPDANSFNGLDSGSYSKESESMSKLLAIGAPLAGLDQTNIKNTLKALVEIKSILQNIQFVDTIISADVQQGNAPLIVNFSSVGSKDPSGFGIDPSQIEWDLDGDGEFGKSTAAKCPESKNSAVVSCIFSKPGTYRVTLRIKTRLGAVNDATGLKWEQEIAPGISYMDILVNPPSTKINLSVAPSAGGPEQSIIKYNSQTQQVESDSDKVYVLLSQAKAGLTFDATKSTLPDGNTTLANDVSSKIRWNFGVNSVSNDTYMAASEKSLKTEQIYQQAGNYQVNFEVTDKNNVVDRKIFTLVVSNVAPIITNPPLSGGVGTELTFDGSNSASDSGSIIFNWKIEKLGAPVLTSFASPVYNLLGNVAHAATVFSDIPKPTISANPVTLPAKTLEPTKRAEENDFYKCSMPDGKDDTLKCNFKKAGQYQVTLALTDQEGKQSPVSSPVNISSNPPTAGFKMVKLNQSAPALYKLDASSLSFDSDEKDNSTMAYSWEINPGTCNLIGFADNTPEGDLIAASTDAFSSQTPCSKIAEFNLGTSQPVVKFTQKGSYAVNLVVRTSDEPNLLSNPAEEVLIVDNVLDVSWGNMKPSALLQVSGSTAPLAPDQLPEAINTQAIAPISFIFNSSQAISYDIDFGDGLTESGDMTKGIAKQVVHNYNKTGKYTVNLSVFDADDIENTLSRKVFIGDSDNPIAIITTKVNGSEIQPQDITLENGTKLDNVITVNRKDSVVFDADKSINTDGTSRRLLYSWNINENEKQSTNKQVSHNFTSTSEQGKPYVIKLKASNDRDASQNGEDSVNILVVGAQPSARSLTAVPQGSSLTTPVPINLNAVGAGDPDGNVVQYKWWYYDANKPPSPDERLGLQITTVPSATINIGTRGLEGEQPKYAFGLEMTDNDNLTVSTDSQDDNKKLNLIAPTVQVTNGPNKAPVARFTVDRTSISIGEAINLTSSSFDPDAGGGIKEYKWDFGDGTKGENKASVSHIYQKANVDGYKVKLTVIDSNSSEATSDTVRIFVDAQAGPPVAAFTTVQAVGSKSVKFTNTSKADEAAGSSLVKYSWDFDVATDSNGDGKNDNDIDTGDQNPSYTYPDFGIFRAKLTVEDDQGQAKSVINFVNVKPAATKPTTTAFIDDQSSGNSTPTNGSHSGTKTLGADLFVAGDKVDPGLLIVSVAAYAILHLIARSKNKQLAKNK